MFPASMVSRLRVVTKVWALLLVGLFVIVVAGAFGIRKAQRIHHKLEVISRIHFVTASMRGYVEDYGTFPESLESFAAALNLDASVIGPLHDERIIYTRPSTNDADSVVILTVTGDGFETVVTKGFERLTKDIQ